MSGLDDVTDRLLLPVDRLQDDTADAVARGDVDALLRAHLSPVAWEPLRGTPATLTLDEIQAGLDKLRADFPDEWRAVLGPVLPGPGVTYGAPRVFVDEPAMPMNWWRAMQAMDRDDTFGLSIASGAQGPALSFNAEALPEPVPDALHGICAECGAYWRCEHQAAERPDEEHQPMADVGPGFAVGPNRATVAGILEPEPWRDDQFDRKPEPWDASAAMRSGTVAADALRAISGGPSAFLDYAFKHPAQFPVGDPPPYVQINTPRFVPPDPPSPDSLLAKLPTTLLGVEVAGDVVAAYTHAERTGAYDAQDALFRAVQSMVHLYGPSLAPTGTGRPTLWALWDWMRDRDPAGAELLHAYARRFEGMNAGRRWLVG